MPDIIIHLSHEQLEELLQKNKVVINMGSSVVFQPNHALNQQGTTFFEFFEEQIEKLKKEGNQRTQETYKAALTKFRSFLKEKDILPSQLTSDLMEAYQVYLREHDLAMNTVSFYMRILRAVYNKTVELGMTEDHHPFRHVYTGMAKTSKRAISIKEISTLKNFTTCDKNLAFARDMFLFSFYTRGMSFVDMANLKKSDIQNGVLTYKRRKTGQHLNIRWEKKMQDIIDKYASDTNEFLLPLIHKRNGKERNQYRNSQTIINRNLKVIARLSGISQKLTMYVARHSWATIARQMKVPIEVISRGMGHTNQKTTEIYLKSIDINIIDEANSRIINSV